MTDQHQPEDDLDRRIVAAMAEPVADLAPDIEEALVLASKLTAIDPVRLGAGGDSQTWATVMQVRELLAPWWQAVHGSRMAAESLRTGRNP